MRRERIVLIGLLLLQIIAILLYPPSFFQRAPQSIVLPPAFLILFFLALIGINTGVLVPLAGRVSLTFIQGINIVTRLMILFANMRTPSGDWDVPLILTAVLGILLSWFTIVQIEKRHPRFLLLRRKSVG